ETVCEETAMAGLSVARVKAESRVGLHGDVTRGLYLQVARNGTKSWIYRYQVGGKRRLMGLGPVDVVTLAAARDAAHASRRAVLEGRDPIDERRAARDAVALERVKTRTVSEVLDLYLRAHQEGWKGGRTAAQWRASLTRYALPKIGKLPVSLVDVGAVMAVIEELWREKPETASRVRRRVEALLDFAAARGWRTGDNPARWSGHIETLLPARTAVAPVEHLARSEEHTSELQSLRH